MEICNLKESILLKMQDSSNFVTNYIKNNIDEFNKIIEILTLNKNYKINKKIIIEKLNFNLELNEFNFSLRKIRKFFTSLIAIQQIYFKVNFEYISYNLSVLANTLLCESQKFIKEFTKKQFFIEDSYKVNDLIICCMGKLGACELNFSSDVDLIFFYEKDEIFISKLNKEIESLKFYSRMSQNYIKLINDLNYFGFVYRVDMRLRPFGSSGNIVISFNAFKKYVLEYGRDWERYAFVKANLITGNLQEKNALQKIIKKFTYQKLLDYKMIYRIREMRHKILKENILMEHNIKLGRGGIRELEFTVQCFQLIYGGLYPKLQVKSLKKALFNISKLNFIKKEIVYNLYENYVFLRNLENSLQMIDDKQVHNLPLDDDKNLQKYLINAFDKEKYKNFEDLKEKLKKVSLEVSYYFDLLTSFNEYKDDTNLDVKNKKDLISTKNRQEKISINFKYIWKEVEKLEENNKFIAYEILKKVEYIFNKNFLNKIENIEKFKDNIFNLVKLAIKETNYLYFLYEYRFRLKNILSLIYDYPKIFKIIYSHPFLLDYIFRPLNYKEIYINKVSFLRKLSFMLKDVDIDEKNLLNSLRRFKFQYFLQITQAYRNQELTLMQTSDVLSFLAESIIEIVLRIAWEKTLKKFNYEINIINKKPDLAIIAYGKLGGLELSYNSDLDLIFLYDDNAKFNIRFYNYVVKEFKFIMEKNSYEGVLYEIDLRLRPNGEGNNDLATSLKTYEKYQKNFAWTWEHQSLVRARWVAGSTNIIDDFNRKRKDILFNSRHF